MASTGRKSFLSVDSKQSYHKTQKHNRWHNNPMVQIVHHKLAYVNSVIDPITLDVEKE